jgi:hypothetical protein
MTTVVVVGGRVMMEVGGEGGLVGIGTVVAGLVLVGVMLVASAASISLPNNPMNRTIRGAKMCCRNGFLFHSVDKASALERVRFADVSMSTFHDL